MTRIDTGTAHNPLTLLYTLIAASTVLTGCKEHPAASETQPIFVPKTNGAHLLGAWECISMDRSEGLAHVKYLTATHFTWVTFDRRTMEVLANAGGTWSFMDGTYTERFEFASDSHSHLRGGEFRFKARVEGDKWFHQAKASTPIDVDEVWSRLE